MEARLLSIQLKHVEQEEDVAVDKLVRAAWTEADATLLPLASENKRRGEECEVTAVRCGAATDTFGVILL
uniref:Uncharacterized protein n=1 Tax=Peronospora matthiolae TaxID=2874970 RepID=A0AAV1T4E2_9STRA